MMDTVSQPKENLMPTVVLSISTSRCLTGRSRPHLYNLIKNRLPTHYTISNIVFKYVWQIYSHACNYVIVTRILNKIITFKSVLVSQEQPVIMEHYSATSLYTFYPHHFFHALLYVFERFFACTFFLNKISISIWHPKLASGYAKKPVKTKIYLRSIFFRCGF